MSDLTFCTKCHPAALGRTPEDGDREWVLTFPLEDGQTLTILVGRLGRDSMAANLVNEALDDLLEPPGEDF